MLKKIAAFTMALLIVATLSFTASAKTVSKAENQPLSDYENTYGLYLSSFSDYPDNIGQAKREFFASFLDGKAAWGSYSGKEKVAILSNPADSITTNIEVSASGFYYIDLLYTGILDSDKPIKISVEIDGETPFFEAVALEIPRCYKNEKNIFEEDSLGNQLRPAQIQQNYWQNTPIFQNDVGTNSPYFFYLTEGKHKITIKAINGGVCFADITLKQKNKIQSYKEYKNSYSSKKAAKTEDIVLQGETAERKSDISLYPMTDRTSCATQPFDEGRTVLNTIGGTNWSNPGTWIEWEFEVEKAGLYEIDLRVRQNQNTGMKCYRTISINDEILFSELENYGFSYNRSWYIEKLSDPESKEPFQFYFEPGVYVLKMEATTGEMCEPLAVAEEIITELNDMYHNIIMITGTSPDVYRDYNLEKAIPNLVDDMLSLAKRLDECMAMIKKITGGSGTQAVSINTLSDQLRTLAEHPKSISDRVSNFYSNISAVSAWANSAFNQPIEIDYIRVGTENSKELKANANFVASLVSGIKSFVYSFVVDYDSIGDSSKDSDIVVWTAAGRDQAEALKQLIDRDFTEQNNVNVSLKLVQSGLIEAVVAGSGPDIALSIQMNQPVDFASRGILEPLNNYDGYSEHIKKNFYKTATIPYEYKGNIYALPETQEFNMMFYRTDILTQLGLSVPNTWKELTDTMAVLARNNMQVGITSLTSTSAGVINTAFPKMIITMFMQNDVDFYDNSLRKTNLGSADAIKAFEQLTDFYTKYGLPTYFDANNRFRTGEMPIIISTMSTYNALSISAPEIAGRWEMAEIPGVLREDGTINRADEYTSTCCVMFKTTKNKQAAWKFLKWWTDEEAQYNYGMELEAVLGVSGRYITANKLAFERLPWDSDTSDSIKNQWEEVSTVPQVPGYYFVSRYLTNAISDVIVKSENPRVVLKRYRDTIDAELKRKNEQLDALWGK